MPLIAYFASPAESEFAFTECKLMDHTRGVVGRELLVWLAVAPVPLLQHFTAGTAQDAVPLWAQRLTAPVILSSKQFAIVIF